MIEIRGIWGLGPWHPNVIDYVRGVRARTATEPASHGLIGMALWAITENAMRQLDDVSIRAQDDCARLSGMIDDIARVNKHEIHRIRFAHMLDLSLRLEAIRVSPV